MMIIVHIASRSGVFKWMAIEILKATKGHPKLVLFALAAFTAVASAFLDNVTTVVLIMPVTFVIAKEFECDPVPFLITEVSCIKHRRYRNFNRRSAEYYNRCKSRFKFYGFC